MSKAKLTKGLSLGSIEKEAMPELKDDLEKTTEKRTTLYLDENIHRAIKRYAFMEEIKIKDYINNILRKDLQEKGLL
ncbi:hypothetical protein HEMROJRC1_20430 [Rodentibacter sp. JRC1]|uniref:hypothetical protein n=1 Tax=Rodentibacter sp. JRC1 TaxID=2874504 RepID=UPI001CFDEE10|nr:hypothetical protein [Rodentibacter sp. JRC1]GJI56931.1 hypothetical protein HEMROJRC1_20430 [Rodentibacter sp. JRC1]